MLTARYIAERQLRHGWRSLAAIALLVALVGGLILAAVSAGVRTATAVPRMEQANRPYDLMMAETDGAASTLYTRNWSNHPLVAAAADQFDMYLGPPAGYATKTDLLMHPLQATVVMNGGLYDFARPVVAAGRMPAPDSPDEVLVQQSYAEAHGLHVGDRVQVRSYTTEELGRLYSAAPDAFRAVASSPELGTPHQLTVAGIGSTQDALDPYPGVEPYPFAAGPGLLQTLATGTVAHGWQGLVRLRDPETLPAFEADVERAVPNRTVVFQTWAVSRSVYQRAFLPVAVALWAFAAIVALLGVLLVGQAVSRRLGRDAAAFHSLAALGVTHRERTLAGLLLVLPAIVVGSAAAVLVAFLASLVTPVGAARVAEVSPGLVFDPLVLGVGAAVLCAFFLAVAVRPARRASRVGAQEPAGAGSAAAATLASWGAPFPITVGVRFALDPGRGVARVPTRGTIVAAAAGVAMAVAALTLAASITRVISDPSQYGETYDGLVYYLDSISPTATPPRPPPALLERELRSDPGVAEVGLLRVDEVTLDGSALTSLTFSGSTTIGPTIVEGRAPRTADEVALGGLTMEQLGVSIGDQVDLVAPAFRGPARVVGRAVLPGIGWFSNTDQSGPGVGAVVAAASLGDFDPDRTWLATFCVTPGTDVQDVYRRVEAAPPLPTEAYGLRDFAAAEVPSLASLRWVPLWLAACLVLVVLVTVTFALALAVRRRLRDLAVLRVLGARRRALRFAGLSQGLTVASCAVVVGVPLGVVIGRWSWIWLGAREGIPAEPVVPLGQVLAFVVVLSLLVGLAGGLAVLLGLRRPTTVVLRDE